jgi:hypothetical protein
VCPIDRDEKYFPQLEDPFVGIINPKAQSPFSLAIDRRENL